MEVRKRRHKDPNLLLAFRIENLEEVLPFSRTTVKELIDLGLFPDGFSPSPGAQKVWTLKVVQSYLDMIGSVGISQLPEIGERIRRLANVKAA